MVKKRLLIEASSIVPPKRSGIGHFTLELVRELDKEEFSDIEVVVFGCIGERNSLEKHNFQRVKVKILPFPHKILTLLTRASLKVPANIFLGKGVYLFPNFRNLYVSKPSKSITYIHDVSFKLYPEFTQPENLSYLLGNIHRWIDRTDTVATISSQSKREIKAELNVPEQKIVVTPLAVDPDVFYPRSSDEVATVCTSLDVEPGEYFLFIGNIEPRKNLEFLIRSYVENSKLKPVSLLIVGGDGWLNESILVAIDEANRKGFQIIRNKRYVDDADLPALMTGAAGVVMPSLHEGFGLPVAQAMACGTPVIASDIPAHHESAGTYATYIDPTDRSQLSAALVATLKQRRTARRIVRTWNDVAREVLKYTLE